MKYTDNMLMTDFYEYTMSYAYFKEGLHKEIAYFDMFVRKIPDKGGYLLFNGLHDFIYFIENFKFEKKHIDYLRSTNEFDEDFLNYLSNLKLTLDIWSVEEGTPVFENEPLVTIRGNYIEAQIIETILLQCINYATLITTKASRIVNAAKGRNVLELGTRRAQGSIAATTGARASIIAGCYKTACTAAGEMYDVPVTGTMAHSYIQLHDNEYDAFLSYAKIYPENCIFLVDTYDTLKSGLPNAIKVAKEYLIPNGYQLKGIRLDSGDLAYLSKKARKMLDDAGLTSTSIIVSNSLDEFIIDDLLRQDAKIDSFGVGESLITAKSTPVLGGVYKVVAVEKGEEIIPKIKISETISKITNPGYKKLYRFYDNDTHKAIADLITLADEVISKDSYELFDPVYPFKRKIITNYYYKQLQVPIYTGGHLVYEIKSTDQVREYCKQQMETLWDEVKRVRFPHRYYVDLSQKLWDLKNDLISARKK